MSQVSEMSNIDDDEIVCTGERVKGGKLILKRKREEKGEKELEKDGKCPEKKCAKILEENRDSKEFTKFLELEKKMNNCCLEDFKDYLNSVSKRGTRTHTFRCCVCKSDANLDEDVISCGDVNCEDVDCMKMRHKSCMEECLSHFCYTCAKEGFSCDKQIHLSCSFCPISFCKTHAPSNDSKRLFKCQICKDLMKKL
jgi:hypothetical protein